MRDYFKAAEFAETTSTKSGLSNILNPCEYFSIFCE
jgi:hypothetical protein